MINTDIVLETGKLWLEPLGPEDTDALYAIAQEEAMWQYFTLNLSSSDMMQQWVNAAMKEKLSGQRIPFKIIRKEDNRICGSTSIGNISEYDRRAEIGWSWLGEAYRGSWINLHAKYAMLRYLFDDLQFERVEFKTDVLNERAKKGLWKLGAKEEGILRSHMQMWNDRRRDSIYFSIIKKEWADLKNTVFKEFHL